MKKEMLLLFGSPHGKEGFTGKLLEQFLAPFSPEEWSTTLCSFFPGLGSWDCPSLSVSPLPCTACGVCKTREGCTFSDLDPLDTLLRRCDVLVLASPIYNSSYPAPVKAWLDRTQRYFEARFSLGLKPPIEKGRQAALLLTQGSEEAFGPQVAEYQLKRAFTVMHTALKGTVVWDNTDRAGILPQVRPLAFSQAEALALEILSEL